MTVWLCKQCDVTWETSPGERVPETCWMCGTDRDSLRLKVECGRPVRNADGSFYEGVGR